MNHAPAQDTTTPLTVIIIGSGLAGIGMAVKLRQAGITDFTILEKAHDVGGVWRDNSFPGAACDIPSHVYSLSFAPNRKWPRTFTSQAEIYNDLQQCVHTYQLATHIQFDAEVQQALYNEADSLWQVSLTDGSQLYAALLISATGFAVTECLAPIRITGRAGLNLSDAWQNGAQAYLGISVPSFPNFFMLYGPNTNMGHNSILYMLKSQIDHVLRCYQTMQTTQATRIEVHDRSYRHFNNRIQKHLANSLWQGCKSWYVDKSRHSSSIWPSFNLSYRCLTHVLGVQAYSFTRALPDSLSTVEGVTVAEPQNSLEKFNAGMLRRSLRFTFRAFMGPPFSAKAQRRVVNLFSAMTPGVGGVILQQLTANEVPTQIITPKTSQADGVILYLHGGAFCFGSAKSHRSLTTRLAVETGMPVWVPEYRLAPEHPYPAGLDDALACYAKLRKYYAAEQIVVGGDSAGGTLALALALSLRERGENLPTALLLLSPATDGTLSGPTLVSKYGEDPMLRRAWLEQVLHWYKPPLDADTHRPLEVDLAGLPPMLIHVGEQELLLSDSTRLAQHATDCGVLCRLEIHSARWHVFHLQASSLQSARHAIRTLGVFARQHVTAKVAAASVIPSSKSNH